VDIQLKALKQRQQIIDFFHYHEEDAWRGTIWIDENDKEVMAPPWLITTPPQPSAPVTAEQEGVNKGLNVFLENIVPKFFTVVATPYYTTYTDKDTGLVYFLGTEEEAKEQKFAAPIAGYLNEVDPNHDISKAEGSKIYRNYYRHTYILEPLVWQKTVGQGKADESDEEADVLDTEKEAELDEDDAEPPSDESESEAEAEGEEPPSDESESEAEAEAEGEQPTEEWLAAQKAALEEEGAAPSDESEEEEEVPEEEGAEPPSDESEAEEEVPEEEGAEPPSDESEAEEEEEVPEEEEPVLDPIVEEALQPAEPIVPEPEEEEAAAPEEDKPDAEEAPNALLDQATAMKAKGPVDYLNFIQDNSFTPESWGKFVKAQKRPDLEYQEGGPVVADETAAETYETPQEALAKAQGGAAPDKWRKFFGLGLSGSGVGSHVPPSKIMKNLWLGNSKDSQDEEFLKANKIKVVFNCTPDKPEAPGIRTIRFSIHDHPDDDLKMMKEGLGIAGEIIAEAEKHPVLVHCIEGRQRSATVVALIMGLKNPQKLSKVIQELRKKRPIALTPEPTFKKALGRWFNT
jgi:hypothetical protein